MKRIKQGEGKNIGCSGYLYKGYEIYSVYYHPEHRVVWEAISIENGDADYHAFTKASIKFLIDQSNP